MANANASLPDNLKALIRHLSTKQAIPLSKMQDIPFLAVKIDADKENLITGGGVRCELKPSIFNIDFEEKTVAMCILQLRLNDNPEYIYTVVYNLKDGKHYSDCDAILNMKKYGLLIASDNIHDFLVFDTVFEAPFDPRTVIEAARNDATEYTPELFRQIAGTLYRQSADATQMWEEFNKIAPFEKEWYARLRMDLPSSKE